MFAVIGVYGQPDRDVSSPVKARARVQAREAGWVDATDGTVRICADPRGGIYCAVIRMWVSGRRQKVVALQLQGEVVLAASKPSHVAYPRAPKGPRDSVSTKTGKQERAPSLFVKPTLDSVA